MRGYDTLAGSFLGLESLDMDYIFIGAIALAVLVLMLIVLLIVQSVKMGRQCLPDSQFVASDHMNFDPAD